MVGLFHIYCKSIFFIKPFLINIGKYMLA